MKAICIQRRKLNRRALFEAKISIISAFVISISGCTCISKRDSRRDSEIVERMAVLSLASEEKARSAVQLVSGKVAKICKSFLIFGKSLHRERQEMRSAFGALLQILFHNSNSAVRMHDDVEGKKTLYLAMRSDICENLQFLICTGNKIEKAVTNSRI